MVLGTSARTGRAQILASTSDDNNSIIRDSPSTKETNFVDRPFLAVTDLLTLTMFAGIGKASHTTASSTLQDLQSILFTAAPFILAWFASSPITGIYTRIVSPTDKTSNLIQQSLVQTAKGWIVAIPIGCAIRGIIKGYVPPLPFVIVTMVATLVLLCTMRVVFILAEKKINKGLPNDP